MKLEPLRGLLYLAPGAQLVQARPIVCTSRVDELKNGEKPASASSQGITRQGHMVRFCRRPSGSPGAIGPATLNSLLLLGYYSSRKPARFEVSDGIISG
jgi:hypothetical protein